MRKAEFVVYRKKQEVNDVKVRGVLRCQLILLQESALVEGR